MLDYWFVMWYVPLYVNVTQLVVKGEVGDVDVTSRPDNTRRIPFDITVAFQSDAIV
jgi:hypothetical protein